MPARCCVAPTRGRPVQRARHDRCARKDHRASGAILGLVTPPAATEPACAGAEVEAAAKQPGRTLAIERRTFDSLDRGVWDRLVAATPSATPFSAWAFHRAWWDAYGENAHEQTLVAVDPDRPREPVAILPLMHRHEVEPRDYELRTTMRHGHPAELTAVSPTAKAIFFGASYHADYATLLTPPSELPAVATALARYLSERTPDPHDRVPWEVVDLRRLRCSDPVVDALESAFRACATSQGWLVDVEREDVCPVVTLTDGAGLDDYLATLGKKDRHEIRRKIRRAESAGDVRLVDSPDPVSDLAHFIDLHQRRWGADGLFPATEGGEQSRTFFRRLFEAFGPHGPLRLTFLMVGDRRIAAGVHFETPNRMYYYNAGIDPDARELSPGVVMVARYVERALAAGLRQLDFLRGDEPYKYEWGAVDEPIQRVLVRRAGQ